MTDEMVTKKVVMLRDEAYRKSEKVIREECCQKCHDGVCETCNVQRAIKRLWEVL